MRSSRDKNRIYLRVVSTMTTGQTAPSRRFRTKNFMKQLYCTLYNVYCEYGVMKALEKR
jgi:hypothetical protein